MAVLKQVISTIILIFLFISFSTVIASCSKTVNEHDTTIEIVKDTIIDKDTIYDFKTGLIAYYNFNGGNLNDSSGYGNNIVFNNNAVKTTDRFGVANNAYLFDGSSSYMTVKDSVSLNPSKITIFAIVKVNGFYTGSCGGNRIVSKGYPDDVNGFYSLQFFDYSSNCGVPNTSNETFSGDFGDNYPQGAAAGIAIDSVKVKTGQWYYLTYTYDGTTSSFYINGQLKGTQVKTVPFHANNFDLWIGKHEDPPFPYYFNGAIDEIRIYNRAMSAAAVNKLSTL
jgi:hypothetical protein